MIQFNKMPYIYMNQIEKCSLLQRYILVHCYLYYEMNKSIISDQEYDSTAKQLKSMLNKMNEKEIVKTEYGYAFENFCSDTGFDLFYLLSEKDKSYIKKIANIVFRVYRKGK